MKILLSAYACEPGRGSEPGVGWEWVRNLSRDHTLWVVTRANNREAIEEASHELAGEVHFLYVDLPGVFRFWKRGNRGVNLYYLLWQFLAWMRCRPLVARHKINLAHHVTLMSVTRFTFVPLLGIPSIVGPVGGVQKCPPGARLLIRHQLREALRDISIDLLKVNPLFRLTASRTTKLILATHSGKEALPTELLENRTFVCQVGSAIPGPDDSPAVAPVPSWLKGCFTVLWSARLEDHKGLEILIRAAAWLKNEGHPLAGHIQIVITGKGPEKDYYLHLMNLLGVRDFFHFAGWLDQEEYEGLWQSVDVFAFTSLRETTGVVVQEAMLCGKPSVVVAHGGPGEMVTPETGISVEPVSLEHLVQGFARGLVTLYEHPELRHSLGAKARERALALYSWPAVASRMEEIYTRISPDGKAL